MNNKLGHLNKQLTNLGWLEKSDITSIHAWVLV